MIDKLKKNWEVLMKQFEDFKDFAELDVINGRAFWQARKRSRALHSWTSGIRGEFYEHMWRWVMYRDTLFEVIALWLFAEWIGWVDLISITIHL